MEALVGCGRMVSGCSVGEGLCMERCAGGAQDNAIINRIMLRFRPIAPKPAAGGSSSGGSTSENRNVVVARGRGKRKYVRVRKYNRCRRKKRTAEEEIRDGLEKTVQTLQLLPEKADGSDSPAGASWCNLERSETTKPIRETPPFWLTFNGENTWSALDRGVVREATMIVVESWVTVECVRSACMEGGGLGSTDLERRKNLEGDTCPGLISDGLNKVEWVNDAYKRMVSQEISNGRWPECWVWLVAKEKLPYMYPAFTCRVRLQYTFGKEKHSQTVPCDAWRMDRGGFAWRLDIKAALSLGR